MDKYEAAMKLDEIQRLIEKQFYHKALNIIDTLNLNKIKNPSDLNMIVKVFIECEQYENAMELLLRIRKKVNTRRILHQLVHVSIQLRDINNAEKFLKEFKKIAPKDTYQWVFTYQIYKLKGKSITSCIEVLEELKSLDYREQWAYELAKLYHKNGDVQSCINECNDIILWFSEGIFVEKAKLLRAYYLENLNPEDLLRQQREDMSNHISKPKEEEEYSQRNEVDSKVNVAEEETDEDVKEEIETEDSQINEYEANELEIEAETYESEVEVEAEASQTNELETEEIVEETDTYQADESETEEVEEGTDEEVEAELETEDSQINEFETDELEIVPEAYESEIKIEEESSQANEIETETPQPNELETHEAESEAKVLDTDNHNDMEAVHEVAGHLEAEKTQMSEPSMAQLEEEPPVEELQPEGDINESDLTEDGEELELEQKPIIENKIIKKLSNLGVDYKAIFDEYLCVEDIQSQIFDSLEQIMVGYTKHNNMIITGDKKSGKSTIGKRMVMLLFQLNICSNTQLAQIDALKINQMDLIKRKDQLMNRCLIIEKAGKLSDKSVHDIMKIIQTSQGKVLFILEDEEEEMNRFLKKHVDFSYVFGIWIHIPKYNEEELFSFVNYFLSFKEFSLSREATLYMKQYISELVQNNEDNRLFLIMEKITMAYHCAKERNKLELRNTTVSKRCKDIDFMTIQKEDFQ